MSILTLISDTNVLIDIEDGQLTQLMFQLPYFFAVPDALYETELREQHGHLLKAGLKVLSLSAPFVEKVAQLGIKYQRPSVIDRFAMALALQEQCPLLTGDRHLRIAAISEGIDVRGTIWIVDELFRANLIEYPQAQESFEAMKHKGSRLPWNEVDNLLSRWELVNSKKL